LQDPLEVVNKHGADALRLYLINSPVVRAETLKFKEEGVFGVVKEVFLPWYNAYRCVTGCGGWGGGFRGRGVGWGWGGGAHARSLRQAWW
jgi:hypothetical protein